MPGIAALEQEGEELKAGLCSESPDVNIEKEDSGFGRSFSYVVMQY